PLSVSGYTSDQFGSYRGKLPRRRSGDGDGSAEARADTQHGPGCAGESLCRKISGPNPIYEQLDRTALRETCAMDGSPTPALCDRTYVRRSKQNVDRNGRRLLQASPYRRNDTTPITVLSELAAGYSKSPIQIRPHERRAYIVLMG